MTDLSDDDVLLATLTRALRDLARAKTVFAVSTSRDGLFVVHPDAIQPGHSLTILIDRRPTGQLAVEATVVATSDPRCGLAPRM